MKTNTTSHPGSLLRALCAALFAIAVLFAAPAAVRAQSFYVSTGDGQTIDLVSPTGAVSVFAILPAGSNPAGLAVDGSGNLYAADYNTAQISKITPGGVVSLFVNLPAGYTPYGLAFDGSGNLYVSGDTTSQIYKITPGGVVSPFANVSRPAGLAFDSSGNLYAAGYVTEQISKITPGGTVSVFATLPGAFGPQGLAFDGNGNLYAAGIRGSTNYISKITPGGTVSIFATLPGAPEPYGLAFDGNGNLYAPLNLGNQIIKISPGGTVSTFVPSINRPTFIAVVPVVTLPDLQVTNLTITSHHAPQGHKVTITATVSNTGSAAAGASTTNFFDGVAAIAGANTPAIPAGGSVDVSVDWRTASENGTHTLQATADWSNVVTESGETNNSADITVDIRGNKALFWQFLFPE